NIRKRKDGLWEGRYTAGVDPETGKPIAKSVLARTQRECKEKLQKAMEELEKFDVTKRRDYTVGERAQLWYENYAKPSVRASTAAYYKNYIDQHNVPRIGDVKLTALTTLQIQKLYNETESERKSAAVRKHGRSESQQQDDSRTAHDAAAVPGAGSDGATDSGQSRKRLPPAEEGKEEMDTTAGEDSGLPESGGGMGRPADVRSWNSARVCGAGNWWRYYGVT
ncbi:MAG: N-terminal phage integrase SAM-like domain-containing protein, partial [Oscillospiraceae bacterium]